MKLKKLACGIAAGVLALSSAQSNAAVVFTGSVTPDNSGSAVISYLFDAQPAGTTQRLIIDIFSGIIESATTFTDEFYQYDQIANPNDNLGNDVRATGACTAIAGSSTCDSEISFGRSTTLLGSPLQTAIFQASVPALDARCQVDQVGCFAIYDRLVTHDMAVAVRSSAQVSYRISLDTFSSAVPEPASWAMMIVGFGMVGSIMRKRSSSSTFQQQRAA